MKIYDKSRLYAAILSMLKPIAGLLIRNNVGAREFCELAKTAFVEVATESYGLRGRPTNTSKTSAITDLTRKEVRRIRDKLDAGQPLAMQKTSVADEILKKWTTDPGYLDSDGKPKCIPIEGSAPSFSDLIHQVGRDIPAGAMLPALQHVGAIMLKTGDSLSARTVLSGNGDRIDRVVSALTHSIEPVCQCVAHNLENEQEQPMWPTVIIDSGSIRYKDTQRFRSISRKFMAKLKTEIENLFIAYETMQADDKPESDDFYVSITTFYTESRNSQDD